MYFEYYGNIYYNHYECANVLIYTACKVWQKWEYNVQYGNRECVRNW